MIEDCLIRILSFLKFNTLIKLNNLNKNFHLTIELVVKTYSPKKILKLLRYAITINHFPLFRSLENYLDRKHIFYLLRYASHKKNITFVEYLLSYTESKLIRRCIDDMITVRRYDKESLYIIYKMYFFLMMVDDVEAALCHLNKISRKISSTRTYWTGLYNSKNLQISKENYTTSESWLVEYEKELSIQYKIDKLFKILSNPSSHDFYNLDYVEEGETLFIELPFNILNFNEKINQLWNRWLLLKSQYLNENGNFNNCFAAPQIMVNFNKDQYIINFLFSYPDNNTYKYTYHISEEFLQKFFKLVLSCGVDIYNTSHHRVKYL